MKSPRGTAAVRVRFKTRPSQKTCLRIISRQRRRVASRPTDYWRERLSGDARRAFAFSFLEKVFFVSGAGMAFDHFIAKGGQRLRLGFTTGTCAALAANAAARMLLGGRVVADSSLVTPKGIAVEVPVLDAVLSPGEAACSVRKDAGDDPDATDGILVRAVVRTCAGDAVVIDGGDGVGRVTRPGLDQPVGAAAINSVPRRMIMEAVEKARGDHGYGGGLSVVISIPGGAEAAARTFNPHLGIVGGLSVIGTSGIVEPMSAAALVDTMRVELNVVREEGGRDVVFTPGNYGEEFVRGREELSRKPQVKCSNFVGEALDAAVELGFSRVLIVGHIGKLIKLAGGIMDTHSRVADCRLELLALHAALAGADSRLLPEILGAATVDEGLALVGGLRDDAVRLLVARAEMYVRRRVGGVLCVGVMMFSGRAALTVASDEAEKILDAWRNDD